MAEKPLPVHKSEHPTSRRRAILRLAFGQLQVMGATATLVLLLQGGVTAPAIWAAALTAAATLTSILLFRLIWRDKSKHPHRPFAEQGVFHWPPKM